MVSANFKGMVLSMSWGGKMTDKQIDHIIEWIKANVHPSHYKDYARVAWQYDAEELKDRILELVDQ